MVCDYEHQKEHVYLCLLKVHGNVKEHGERRGGRLYVMMYQREPSASQKLSHTP